MRLKAQQAGKLSSTSQQTVNTTNDGGQPIIDIEPANPQVIYIPQYDPAYIWGAPLYYPYASWFYPPFGPGIYFGFGPGIPIGLWFGGGWGGWGGWGWHPGWGGHNIVVNNNFIHRYNYNASRGGSLSGRSNWSHDASHRGGVPYSTPALSTRYGGGARQNLQARAAAQGETRGAQRQTEGGQTRQSTPGQSGQSQATQRMGNRQIPSNSANANRGVFGGVHEGGAARTQSDHGFSSMGSHGGGGGAPHGGGGGGHAGGGGRR
jgi:hypothetical protein